MTTDPGHAPRHPEPGDRVISLNRNGRRSVGRVIEPGPGDTTHASPGEVLVAWPNIDAGPTRAWHPTTDLHIIGGN